MKKGKNQIVVVRNKNDSAYSANSKECRMYVELKNINIFSKNMWYLSYFLWMYSKY